MINTKYRRRIYITGQISLIALLLILVSSFFDSENDNPSEKRAIQSTVKAPQLPKKLSFAGEYVPLERKDIVEALDRELLVGTFFHSQTILYLKKAPEYLPIVQKILEEEQVPMDFQYLPFVESAYSNVVSPRGAAGYWQILEKTGRELGLEVNDEVDERYHLEKSSHAACRFLKESYEKFGSWTLAAASYNMGRSRLASELERQKGASYYDIILNEETARYLFRILATKLILENPRDYGFNISNSDCYQPEEMHLLEVDSSVSHFADFAAEFGLNYKQLKYYNPWLRNHYLNNPKHLNYKIAIPESVYKKSSKK